MELLIIVWAVIAFVGLPFVCIAIAFVMVLATDRFGHLCVDLFHGLTAYVMSHHHRRSA
jgi:hypothetical protein